MNKNKIDPSKIISSLKNQIADNAYLLAEREALIEMIGANYQELKQENEELKLQLEEFKETKKSKV